MAHSAMRGVKDRSLCRILSAQLFCNIIFLCFGGRDKARHEQCNDRDKRPTKRPARHAGHRLIFQVLCVSHRESPFFMVPFKVSLFSRRALMAINWLRNQNSSTFAGSRALQLGINQSEQRTCCLTFCPNQDRPRAISPEVVHSTSRTLPNRAVPGLRCWRFSSHPVKNATG